MPYSLSRSVYLALYGIWWLGPISILEALVYISVVSKHDTSVSALDSLSTGEKEIIMAIGMLMVLAMMGTGWIVSMAMLRETKRAIQPFVGLYGTSHSSKYDLIQRPLADRLSVPEPALIDLKYILPFAGFLASFVGLIPLLNLIDTL